MAEGGRGGRRGRRTGRNSKSLTDSPRRARYTAAKQPASPPPTMPSGGGSLFLRQPTSPPCSAPGTFPDTEASSSKGRAFRGLGSSRLSPVGRPPRFRVPIVAA